jgi:hypothetical protein
MKHWKKIDNYDEKTLPPVGKKVIVLNDEGMPFVSERERDALSVYCGERDDEGYASWWIDMPSK